MKKSRTAVCIVICMLLAALFAPGMPVAQAFDTEIITLQVYGDRSILSAGDAAPLLAKLRTQFKFPKYELFKGSLTPPQGPDSSALVKIAEATGSDGVVILNVKKFQSLVRSDLTNSEMIEDTTVDMTLHYYNKKTGRAGQYDAYQSITQLVSPDSGSTQVALTLLDELLNKLDAVFPRQFSSPRY